MKSFLYILLLTLLSIPVVGQDCDYKSFKKGNFRNYSEGELTPVIITRKKKVQIEKNFETRETFKFKIEWLSESEYTMTPIIKGKNSPAAKRGFDQILHVKLLRCEENSFFIEAHFMEIDAPVFEFRMVKFDVE